MNDEQKMLPHRNLDYRSMAQQIIEQHNLPKEINAYRHHRFHVEDMIVQLLEWRAESQYRVNGGEWRYTYDPVTIDPKMLIVSALDAARIRLGCTEYGCMTMADTNEIELLDENGNILNERLERTE